MAHKITPNRQSSTVTFAVSEPIQEVLNVDPSRIKCEMKEMK